MGLREFAHWYLMRTVLLTHTITTVRTLLVATSYRRGTAVRDGFRFVHHERRWAPGQTRRAGILRLTEEDEVFEETIVRGTSIRMISTT